MSTTTKLRPALYTFTSSEMARAAVNGIKAAAGSASTDQARPILTNVLIEGCGDHIKLITTNSYRANRVRITVLDPIEFPAVMINAKELVASLPKTSDLPRNGAVAFTLEYEAGPAELDAGRLLLHWGNSERVMRAEPEKAGSPFGKYPEVEKLIQGAIDDKGVTTDPVGYNPAFLADIAKEAKLIDKDRPLHVTPGASPLKPAMFTTSNEDGVSYESLLMPVRL